MSSIVHARLPRTGLGNKLLVWAKAKVFGADNHLPVITTGWAEIKIGPFLRRERFKRYYFGYFRRERLLALLHLICSYLLYNRIKEPKLINQKTSLKSFLYIFCETPLPPDYFEGIRNYRNLIKESFFEIVSKSILNKALKNPPPVIGVHIRRSDFSEKVRTPNEFFIKSIELVREIRGENLPVTIYSDAYAEEISDVLAVGNATMSDAHNDLYDLISLSRSGCLILSYGSTYGYWAGFLADAPILLPHPLTYPIRPFEINYRYYEGKAEENALLVQNIQDIHY